MKNLSPADLAGYRSVSFDIDGTVYPILKVKLRWWRKFFVSPGSALRFYRIKKSWELRRKGDKQVPVSRNDILFFEEFLTSLLDPTLVPAEIHTLIHGLKEKGVEIFFLSDHGASEKLSCLGLEGMAINCLTETGELKPHPKISALLRETYKIDPTRHLHLGDRWTDEEQARIFGSSFRYLRL